MNPIEWLNQNLPPNNMSENARKVIQFVFLWQEYNYKYNKNVPSLNDVSGALSLANCPIAQIEYNNFKNDFISKFEIIPSTCSNNNPRKKLCADNGYEREVKYHSGKDSLEDFLRVVYQIRCNFIHGGKMRENEENDVKLVCWAHDCLDKLLSRIHYFN